MDERRRGTGRAARLARRLTTAGHKHQENKKATAPCRADAVAFALFRFRSQHNRKTQTERFADFGDSVKRDIHTSVFDAAEVAGIKTTAVEAAPGPKKESDE